MRFLLKSASFIFHPLWLPLAGSFLYFIFTPRFFPEGVVQAKLLAIAILTIFIPIVFYFLLKNLGKAQSVFLVDVKERKWPLIFYTILGLSSVTGGCFGAVLLGSVSGRFATLQLVRTYIFTSKMC